MHLLNRICLPLLLALALCAPALANGIMLDPLRIVVPDGQRYAALTILNQSSAEPIIYNISTVPLRMQEDGSLYEPTTLTKREALTRSMLRFSPRTARLQPGGKQAVRIAVRKPPNLPEGEYMSYISVTPLDTPESVAPKLDHAASLAPKGSSMVVDVKVGMRIPVIIYQGSPSVQTAVSAVRAIRRKDGKAYLDLRLNRTGNRSSFVETSVFRVANGRKELIAHKDRTVTYFPLAARTLTLPISDPEFRGGRILVELRNYKDATQTVIDSKEFSVQLP